MINKCPLCKSKNIIKRGKNNDGKQRYFCNSCKKHFQPKAALPSWVDKAYADYVFNNLVLKNLSTKYGKSIKTIRKYFDILNNKIDSEVSKNNKKQSINLILDGTFFKKKQWIFGF